MIKYCKREKIQLGSVALCIFDTRNPMYIGTPKMYNIEYDEKEK